MEDKILDALEVGLEGIDEDLTLGNRQDATPFYPRGTRMLNLTTPEGHHYIVAVMRKS